MFAPLGSQKTVCKHKDPITGNSFISQHFPGERIPGSPSPPPPIKISRLWCPSAALVTNSRLGPQTHKVEDSKSLAMVGVAKARHHFSTSFFNYTFCTNLDNTDGEMVPHSKPTTLMSTF